MAVVQRALWRRTGWASIRKAAADHRQLNAVAPEQAKDVRRAVRLAPRGGELRALQHVPGHRHDLLANEDSEQPNQRHHRRRWRSPHIEQAVDDAHQETGAER